MNYVGFKLAFLYGKYFPINIGKWKIVNIILKIFNISPYDSMSNWNNFPWVNKEYIANFEGIRILNSANSNLSVFLLNTYEPYVIRVLKKIICLDSVVFDVGANVGIMSLIAANKAVKGRVYAFEPVKETFSKLSQNIALNNLPSDRIILNNYGLSDSDSDCQIFLPIENGVVNTGQASISGSMMRGLNKKIINSEIISLKKLDSLNIDRIDVLKIDVEGAEFKCLTGGKNTLIKFKPLIIFELNTSFSDYSSKEIFEFLVSCGYTKFSKIMRTGLVDISDYEEIGGTGVNVLCSAR